MIALKTIDTDRLVKQKHTNNIPLNMIYYINMCNHVNKLYRKVKSSTTGFTHDVPLKYMSDYEMVYVLKHYFKKYLDNALMNNANAHIKGIDKHAIYDVIGAISCDDNFEDIKDVPSIIFMNDINVNVFKDAVIGSIIVLKLTLKDIISDEFKRLLTAYCYDFAQISFNKNVYNDPFDDGICVYFIHKVARSFDAHLSYIDVNTSIIQYIVLSTLYRKLLLYLQYFMTCNDSNKHVKQLLTCVNILNNSIQRTKA